MGRDARRATVVLGTRNDEYERGLARAEKATQTWGNRVKGHISKSLRGAFGGLGGVMGLAGIAGFGALARDVKVFNDRLVRLQISANKSRGEMLAFNRALQQTATVTGASQDEILAGAQKYTELTGKFDEFAASMDTFAKAQVATGASMESLVGAAAALSTNLQVDPSQMLAALDAITSQGKQGKIEIRELAQELPGLTGQFSQFGTVGAKGVIELGAAMQVMARGFGTASETATGMQSLMTAMVKNSSKVEGLGVKVFTKGPNGVRQLRDFADIIFDLIAKSKGDPKVLQHVLGRQEALQALIPLMQGGRAEFDRFIELGKQGGVIMSDFGIASESAGGKMAKAKAHFLAVFNDALMKNMDAIVSAFEALVRALSWMASHPEALAGLALLWKGGGLAGTLGALGMNMGGGGGAGGAVGGLAGAAGAGVNAGGARALNIGGRAMQGAAIGYTLAQLAPQVGGALDVVDTAATTVAGAMAALPGPLGLAGKAALVLKGAFDIASAHIDARNEAIAAQQMGDQATQERSAALRGQTKLVQDSQGNWSYQHVGSTANEHDKRTGAQSVMRQLFQGGAGVAAMGRVGFDREKATSVFKGLYPGKSDEEIGNLIKDAEAGRDYLNSDVHRSAAFVSEMDPKNALPGSMTLFHAPEGQQPFYQQFPGGDAAPTPSWGAAMGAEILIKIAPLEGYDVTAQKKTRRKGK